MKGRFILAHDTGTGGSKAVLTDLHGNVLHTQFQGYHVDYPKPGWAEQDPDLLWRAVAETSKKVIEESGVDPGQIIGLCVSAQMLNILPVDDQGRPLIQMLSWLDTRSVPQADRILQTPGRAFFFARTGNVPTAKDMIPKILWVKEERPEIWENTFKLLDCKEYILHKITGRFVTDWHGASMYFLFDPRTRMWCDEVCQVLGIPRERLPETRPCVDVIGEVQPHAADEMGLRPGTPVVVGAGDLGVAQVGVGAVGTGKVNLCVSTATWIAVSSDRFVNDPERPFWILSHVDPQKWIVSGEMETGGGSLMWFRDSLCQAESERAEKEGLSTYQLLSRMVERVEPGSNGLLFTPWLSGERAPVLDHYLKGAFVGLTLGHTKAHMARAIMEGVAFHLRWILEQLEKLGLRIEDVTASGGGNTSPVWSQIISDVIQREMHVVALPQEAGALGAALTAAVGLGVYPDMEAVDGLARFSRVVRPDAGHFNTYDRLYKEYRNLYDVFSPIYRRMHKSGI